MIISFQDIDHKIVIVNMDNVISIQIKGSESNYFNEVIILPVSKTHTNLSDIIHYVSKEESLRVASLFNSK